MKISLIDSNENRILQNDIIRKIRDLINSKNLERGEKLPSERVISEKINVKRNHIKEAIKRLEFYGVVKSISQSGTFLTIGLTGFNGIVEEILTIDSPSFVELAETRISLELKTVALASQRRTEEDLIRIEETLKAFELKITNGQDYLEEDLLFHLAIAKASKNSTMLSVMLLIIPPILDTYERDAVCDGDQVITEINKHKDIYLAIKAKDTKKAEEMMQKHFFKLCKFIENNKA